MKQKIKQVKDKEGVVFVLSLDSKVSKKSQERNTNLFVKSVIEEKLNTYNVYPTNNKVGFTGDIDSVSFYFSSMIDAYLEFYFIENQLDII